MSTTRRAHRYLVLLITRFRTLKLPLSSGIGDQWIRGMLILLSIGFRYGIVIRPQLGVVTRGLVRMKTMLRLPKRVLLFRKYGVGLR